MKDSNRSICLNSPNTSPVSFATEDRCRHTDQVTERQKLSFTTGGTGEPDSTSFSTTRCSEKGCVFPAASRGGGMCTYHLHQQEEPVLFRSHQPTGLLLDPARMSPTEKEYGCSHKRDRRRMTVLWEQFQSDGTL